MDYLQHSIVAGLVFGGCRIDDGSQTPALDVRTTRLTFAVWLYENLGWMANTIHRAVPGEKQTRPKYIVRTVPHPKIDWYRRWRAGESRPPAAETIYSPYSVRVWVAKTAGVGWSGVSESRVTRFHAESDGRREWYGAVLRYLGYDPYDSGRRYELDQSESRDLFDCIGSPVPGVEHKWSFEKDDYENRRSEQWVTSQLEQDQGFSEGVLGARPRPSNRKHSERDAIVALREAATNGKLIGERYREWSASNPAAPLFESLRKMMRWGVWKSLAGLEPTQQDGNPLLNRRI